MKKLSIYRINAFTSDPFGGNPAAVLMSDELSDREMQKIAAEMNLSETAFLSKSGVADFRLRWMTPSVEVDLCGHATIASLHYLKENNILKENSAVSFETRSGIINCFINKDLYSMHIPGYNTIDFKGDTSALLDSLNINRNDVVNNIVLLENGYIYLHVKSLDNLGGLHPDFEALKRYSMNSGVKSYVLYSLQTIEKNSSAHLRFFDPVEGINEDPVTGSANGPLIKVLIFNRELKDEDQELQFEQGDFMGRPGRVNVKYKNKQIVIGGDAVTFFKGEIFI